MLRKWNKLPKYMRTEAVRPYYEKLHKKKKSLALKRVFDFVVSFVMLVVLLPVFIILSVLILIDSKGGVLFIQERITQYGRKFKIFKFRTMVVNAENFGSQVTVSNDLRVTKMGKVLRKYRLDELPQLVNIFLGDMSFVGTRPEVPQYVKNYTAEMMATLLLPAGVTSEASIQYKDENKLLEVADDVDMVYIKEVLPEKMKYNLESIEKYNFFGEIKTMIKTMSAIAR